MPQGQDPMLARRRLRDALRRHREQAGFTQREVAEEMDWSPSKLIRIEAGQVAVSTTDLRALLQHYGVTDPEQTAALVALSRTARERAWWSAYQSVASIEFRQFLGFESSASIIRNFEPLVVPGLLQTREYAREVLVAEGNGPRVDEMVELRMERQELLTREDAPELHFILGQGVVERAVGGPQLMRRQLRHIMGIAEYPNVSVRVVPWSAGLYPNYRLAYVVFEFPDAADPAVLYVEGASEMISREGAQDTDPNDFLAAFWEVEQLAPKHLTAERVQAAFDRMGENEFRDQEVDAAQGD
ncbi:helix-turn-helix domain-containing protein [Yinghuangia seranimata]|uniref:helix-turn-helix domain-containing protein n=1 Tax=Yinghuangia seranimata TaxID=408067 RepID=UPI00248C8101|nr:helix-turn-helix transcriptional regulator [Yinghuangia seranimata]MDI2124908.1 helix-turn-helix transcriptional regulator [Yinghuangia seranimata]